MPRPAMGRPPSHRVGDVVGTWTIVERSDEYGYPYRIVCVVCGYERRARSWTLARGLGCSRCARRPTE